MNMRYGLTAAACALWMTLSGCTGIEPVPENLMRPPRLTPEQIAIEDALNEAVLSKPILRYPKSGEYRSAYIFQDIDHDGKEETLVFYATENDPSARLCLLDQREDGTWYSPCELAGAGQEVGFVAFAQMTHTPNVTIVIGWENPDDLQMTLGLYTYDNGQFRSVLGFDQKKPGFEQYLLDDLDRDGLDDLLLLSSRNDRGRLHLVTDRNGEAVFADSQDLSDSILEFPGVTSGRIFLDDLQRGIFIDELVSGDVLVTEVFSMENDKLVPVIYQDMESPLSDPEDGSEPKALPSLYDQAARANITLDPDMAAAPICEDVNKDGVIEIPTAELMPGYEEQEEAERIYLTEYHQIDGDFLRRVFAAAINREGGYRLEFPEEWIGKVTVVRQIENGEWSFREYHEEAKEPLEDLSGELARIRVVSQKDYQDKFLESYVKIAERGVFTYYGYVPKDVDSPLKVTIQQLTKELFALI